MARFATPTTGRRYYGINGHGDLTWTATESAAVSKTVRYDPWGQAIAAPSGQPDFGFQGSWLDPATDLYWVIARWYAPGLGTFVSEDELLGEPVNPRSRHLYAYGWGDPVGMVDVDGRQASQVRELLEEVDWVRQTFGFNVASDFATVSRYAVDASTRFFPHRHQAYTGDSRRMPALHLVSWLDGVGRLV